MVKGIPKNKEWNYCKKHRCTKCSILGIDDSDWFEWKPKVNSCKYRKKKELENFKDDKCDKCGTQEIPLPGAHWEELMIPAGFFCPNCMYLTNTVWGGYGTGTSEGRTISKKEAVELKLITDAQSSVKREVEVAP